MLYGEEYGTMPACSCGNRKPQRHGCVDCQRSYCEQCAAVIDGDLVCSACVAKRADAIEEADEPECTCIEERVDVDRTVAHGPCDIHFPVRGNY